MNSVTKWVVSMFIVPITCFYLAQRICTPDCYRLIKFTTRQVTIDDFAIVVFASNAAYIISYGTIHRPYLTPPAVERFFLVVVYAQASVVRIFWLELVLVFNRFNRFTVLVTLSTGRNTFDRVRIWRSPFKQQHSNTCTISPLFYFVRYCAKRHGKTI